MELVVDTAIIFSFFKPDSYTRGLFKSLYMNRARLYAPQYLLDELLSLEGRICEYACIGREEFMTTYVLLSQVMDIIPAEEYESHLVDALKLLNDHKKDAPFFALALKLRTPVWSNEKRFLEQKEIEILTTAQLKKKLGFI
jgi:predicted nucleic acid-binding protein